jgi:WD40 repeat protein
LAVPYAQAEEAPAEPPPSYEQDVRPIFREHCFVCHDQAGKKGGLVLETYTQAMAGGASGEVVYPGELASSRLWLLVNHEDQPTMPPNQDKLAAAKLDIIRRWIEAGALEKPGDKALRKPQSAWSYQAAAPGNSGPMPLGLCRQPVVATRRPAAISALACSPTAPLVAIGGPHQIVLYGEDDFSFLGVLPFPEGTVLELKFSADGSLLLAGGGRGAHSGSCAVYDVASGDRLTLVGDEPDAVLAADLAPSLALVAMGGPRRIVRIHHAGSGELLHELTKHTDWIQAIAFSPDAKWLATGDRQGGIWIWEASTGREVQPCNGHTAAVTALGWRGDSQMLASSSEDGSLRLWSVPSGQQANSWTAHPPGATSVAFARDGRLVTTGRDRLAKLWDMAGKLLQTFPEFPDIALRAGVTHDGRAVVAGDWTGTVRVWATDSAQQITSPAANIPRLETILSDATTHHNSLQQQIDQLNSQLATARAQLAEANTAYEQSLAAAEQIRLEAAAASGPKSTPDTPSQASPGTPTPDGGTSGDRLAEAERRIGQCALNRAEITRLIAKLEGELNEAQADSQAASAAVDQATSELKTYRERPSQLNQRLLESQQEIGHQQTAMEQLHKLRAALEAMQNATQQVAALIPGDDDPASGLPPIVDTTRQGIAAEQQRLVDRIKNQQAQLDAAARHLERVKTQVELFQGAYPAEEGGG